jgi:hypothetical protein
MPVDYPKPPYPSQKQPMPGSTEKMDPRPHALGETSYKGSGRLKGMRASRGLTVALDEPSRSPRRGRARMF